MSKQTTQAARFGYDRKLKALWPYFIGALLSLAILTWLTRLWNADFKIPFTYYQGGDLFFGAAEVKSLLEAGSSAVNAKLGAPFGLQLYDFPTSEALHFLLLRLLNIVTGDFAETINLIYVFSFPLTTVSALWVFRRFDIGEIPSIACSLFYTFLYAHFWRGLPHLSYACYYLVPLLFWVVLTAGGPSGGRPSGGPVSLLRSYWFAGRLLVCVALASYGFYYSLFGMFFLACGGLFAWAVHKDRTGFLVSLTLALSMVFTSLCNVLPNVFFWAREGRNPGALVRSSIAAEIYGLKLTHLIFPNVGHRLSLLAGFTRSYLEQSGSGESPSESLGLIGVVGLILLLACSLFRNREFFNDPLFELLGTLNLMGLLLATVGGFGTILSFLGFTQIRAYNRISVFLAFPAFMAVALVWRKLERGVSPGWRPIFIFVSAFMAVFGLWDETSAGVVPNYALSSQQWIQDSRYVATLESSIPSGSMIFQLPYVPFPENPPVVEMTDYSHIRPYLHSRHLRWSYGAIKGRKGAAWMETTSALPVRQMLAAVLNAGFAGVYIDRFGYADHAAAIESQLTGLLGTMPIVSEDNRLAYFSLTATSGNGVAQAGASPVLDLFPVDAQWEAEFSGLERNGPDNWRWCGNSGVLRLINRSKDTVWVRMSATVKTAWPENAKVNLKSSMFADELVTNARGLEWERLAAVPPGEHLITFTSNAKKDPASGTTDPRVLVFALHGFTLTRAKAPPSGVAPKELMHSPLEIK